MTEVRPYKGQFAVYENGELLAVCCYRKGAEAVSRRLEQLRQQIATVPSRCIPESVPCANR